MDKIFSDDFFLLAQKAKLNFSQMLEIVNEAARETTKEGYAASIVQSKIVEKLKRIAELKKK